MKTAIGFVAGFVIGGLIFYFALAAKSNGPKQAAPPPSTSCNRAGLPPGGSPRRKIRIGFSSPGADHGWLAAIAADARKAAASHPDVELFLTDGLNSSAKQMADIENLLQRGIDVLVMLPYSGEALTPVAAKVRKAGVPLINLDRKIASEDYYCYIGGNNYGIGVAAARYIGKRLKGKGNVIEITGIAGISVTRERSKGFRDTLAKEFPGITILASQPADFLAEKALTVTQNLLQAHPNVDAIYSHDDDMNVGVLQAVKTAKRDKDLFITGAGGSRWAMEQIKSGASPIQATFLYNPSMAGSAVNLARLVALHKGLSDLWEKEVPREIRLRATTVTKANVDKYLDLGY